MIHRCNDGTLIKPVNIQRRINKIYTIDKFDNFDDINRRVIIDIFLLKLYGLE